MQASFVKRPFGRVAVVLAGLLSLTCGWVASAETMEPRVPQSTVHEVTTGIVMIDPETAQVLLAMGVLEVSDVEASGPVTWLMRSIAGDIDVLVIDSTAGDVSANDTTSEADDGRRWKPSDKLPAWNVEMSECEDGFKTVRFYRSVRVVASCPSGVTYAWVLEEVIWKLKCTTATPASPGPIAPDGNTPYQEGEAWPRNMPRELPSDSGGSSKRLIPPSVSPCN